MMVGNGPFLEHDYPFFALMGGIMFPNGDETLLVQCRCCQLQLTPTTRYNGLPTSIMICIGCYHAVESFKRHEKNGNVRLDLLCHGATPVDISKDQIAILQSPHVCPECRGSGTYIGFTSIEPCSRGCHARD